MATFVDSGGGWLGMVSADPLNFFVNNVNSSLTIDTNGFFGLNLFPSLRSMSLHKVTESNRTHLE